MVEGVGEAAEKLRVGYYSDPGVQMGPLISARHRERVNGHVQSCLAAGAEIVTGGGPVGRDGFFYCPTVMANASSDMQIVREEMFVRWPQ